MPALRFVPEPVKDRLIGGEEHGFLQRARVLQGLHGMLEERGHEVGAILRNFEIEKKEPHAVILAQALDERGEREERDVLPVVLIAIVPQHLGQADVMDGLGLQGWRSADPGGTQHTREAGPQSCHTTTCWSLVRLRSSSRALAPR